MDKQVQTLKQNILVGLAGMIDRFEKDIEEQKDIILEQFEQYANNGDKDALDRCIYAQGRINYIDDNVLLALTNFKNFVIAEKGGDD